MRQNSVITVRHTAITTVIKQYFEDTEKLREITTFSRKTNY